MEDFQDTTDMGASMHTYIRIWPVLPSWGRVVGGLAACGGGTYEDSCDYLGNWKSLLSVDYSELFRHSTYPH